jgi:cyclophilin family peptidyl-prolyl cis-trans isomerase
MSVLLETSRGDVTVDLYVDDTPLAAKNFLKLCKIKYYNNCLFHKVGHVVCQKRPFVDDVCKSAHLAVS